MVYFNGPIPRHHNFFSQQLDHCLPVFETQAVHITSEQGAEVLDIAGNMFPLHRRVTLLFNLGSFLRESLEPLRDLLPPGCQLLQGEHLLLIGVDEPLSLSLSMVSLEVHTISLVLELALLPLLDLLPQRVFLQYCLGMLQQCAYQGPHERIESGGSHKPRWAARRTARRDGVLPCTLIIQRGVALTHAPLPCGLPRSLTMPTAHERPQQIALRGRLRRTARFFLIALQLLLGFRKDGGTHECWRRDRHPLLGRTTLAGIVILPGAACAPCFFAWDSRFGLLIIAVAGVDHMGKDAAHAGRRPYGIPASPSRDMLRVEPLHDLARGQLFMKQPATYLAYHVSLFWVDLHPGRHAGLLGGRALAVNPIRPGHKFGLASFVQASPPRPFSHLTPFVCGNHPLHLGSQLAMGGISKGIRQA